MQNRVDFPGVVLQSPQRICNPKTGKGQEYESSSSGSGSGIELGGPVLC